MRIFIAGATGALGKRLLPLLVVGGHHVIATTRTPDKLTWLRSQGVEPVLLDGLDKDAVTRSVAAANPEVVVHQMTALAALRSLKRLDEEFAVTNRLRTEGTNNLLDAARAAGARTFVAQSFTGWPNARQGDRIKNEDDPLDSNPPRAMAKTLEAIRTLEQTVSNAVGVAGIVLRYGSFYGPGTSLSTDGDIVHMVRHRKFPLIGDSAGVWSFIHIDDAARATQLAIEGGTAGIYNIVDDDPAEVSAWLPDLARAVGARPPLRVPVVVGRLAVGDAGVVMMTEARGSSNAKAKQTLGWKPDYPSWRDGFRRGLAADLPALTPSKPS
jgi:nucleoside-diphosphate-sugar epimerase